MKNNKPHDSWAKYYDFVYQSSYGKHYDNLNRNSIAFINTLISNLSNKSKKKSILDVGAGTGRLSIPLLKDGHRVTAIEMSEEMCGVLREKAIEKKHENNLDIIYDPIQSEKFQLEEKYDLALAVFGVFQYIIDEKELDNSIKKVSNALKPDSYLIFDLPRERMMAKNNTYEIPGLKRVISKKEINKNTFQYSEKTKGVFNGEEFNYHDEFQIRCWKIDEIRNIAEKYGMQVDSAISEQAQNIFNWTGADYYVMKKT